MTDPSRSQPLKISIYAQHVALSTAAFLVLFVGAAWLLIPRVDQRLSALQAELREEAGYVAVAKFERYLRDRELALLDMAATPPVREALAAGKGSGEAAAFGLANHRLLGAEIGLTLVDAAGSVIAGTPADGGPSVGSVSSLLRGEETALARPVEVGGVERLDLAVPVTVDGRTQGVLIASLDWRSEIAIAQEAPGRTTEFVIHRAGPLAAPAREAQQSQAIDVFPLDRYGLSLESRVSKAALTRERNSVAIDFIIVLIVGSLAFYAALLVVGRVLVVRPVRELEQARKALEQTVEGIGQTDEEGHFTFANASLATTYGYEPGALLGRPWLDLIIDRDRERARASFSEIGSKGRVSIEVMGLRGDGSTFPVLMTFVVRQSEGAGAQGYFCFIRDMTEQRSAELALKVANDLRHIVMDESPDVIFVKDPDFRIVDANPAFMALYPPEKRDKVIGYTTLEEYSEEDASQFLEQDKIAFKEGESLVIEAIDFPDGRRRTLSTRKTRFEDADGNQFILGVGRDITDTQDMLDRVTDANIELERFAFVASHDLQEPLRMVINYTGRLEEKYADQLDERAQKYIDFATDGARRMRALIDDLLAYSRISQEAERREPFEAREGVDQAMLNLEEAIKETGAEVTVGELPRVSGNAVRFSRLMQNLIGNGLKYQAKGAVPRIGVSAERRADEWVFMVADNGIGIDEKYLEQIFEPFRRLHNHSQFAGTGIGLAACRKIVQSWSGRIWATSTLGEGTTFYFTIPVDPTFEETEAA